MGLATPSTDTMTIPARRSASQHDQVRLAAKPGPVYSMNTCAPSFRSIAMQNVSPQFSADLQRTPNTSTIVSYTTQQLSNASLR